MLVATLNLWGTYGDWPARRRVLAEGFKALEGDVGDLLGLLRTDRQPWWGQGEEQELSLAGDDATLKIHVREAIWGRTGH